MKKRKALYYLLNLTWGLPLTFIGALIAFALIITKHKPKRHGGCIYFNIGQYWGGLELGLFFLTDQWDSTHVKNHEYGHSIQNAIFGPFTIFIISIPSAIRYWIFQYRSSKGKKNPPYDSIWFEGQATKWGFDTISYW